MANEDAISSELKEKFPFLAETVRVQRARRVFADTPYERFADVLEFVVHTMGFASLSGITGTDDGETLGVMYHFGRPDGTLLNIKTAVPKAAPKLASIHSYFPTGLLYERELVDLLGFEVSGLPEGSRYPLQDDWPAGQWPLRKDWKPEMLDQMKKIKQGEE